ncbi:peptide ABC transporter permease, partial [Shouchella clausii]
YGLDEPMPVQYMNYMVNMLKGDLGVSFQFDNVGVTEILLNSIGPSATLGFQAILFGTIFGIILGVISALKQNTWV